MLYSAKTQGFYLREIHGESIPDDAVEKTDEECAAIREALEAKSLSIDPLILRAEAYRLESDPLFFEEQRGDVPPGTWLAKISEIKMRFPK